ncbi:MAG: hypothetical protein V1776_01970 [Candidatus Diapherotrites archaeon]
MSPNTYSLTSVSARADRKGVDVSFANAHEKRTEFYTFFPSFYLPHTSTNTFETVLEKGVEEKHQTIAHTHSIQVISGTWESLKKIATQIHTFTGYYPSLLEPERQFLLTQKWRYFQSFDGKRIPQTGAFEETQIEGMAEGILTTLRGLHQHNSQLEKQLARQLAISHELGIPPHATSTNVNEQMECLLENTFFQHHLAAPLQSTLPLQRGKWNIEKRKNAEEKGWETPLQHEGKCSCCTPQSGIEAHLTKGSRITVTILQDGVYIHTQHEALSHHYHTTHPHKGKRITRANEWGLDIFPLGPFSRGEKIELPLQEARDAHEAGLGRMEKNMDACTWKCLKEKGILEKLKEELMQRRNYHDMQAGGVLQPYISQYQLAYSQHVWKSPEALLHQEGRNTIQRWMEQLPLHLQNGETRWRDREWAESVQNST